MRWNVTFWQMTQATALALAGSAPAAAQQRPPVTPEYVTELFFKGCLAALNGSIDLSDKATVQKMGMDLQDLNSLFVKHPSGEGALLLGRRDLIGSRPSRNLSIEFFKASKSCSVEFYGKDYLDLKALLQSRFKPLEPASTSNMNETTDVYVTEVSPTEDLKITLTAAVPRSSSWALDVTGEIVKKP